MALEPSDRRLAAIMFTDIVGYTALMAESEQRGLQVRERHRAVVRPLVERYGGEWIEAPGDQSLSTFPTALDAVNAGLAIQAALRDDPELKLHIGVHLGDFVVQGTEISGDGVNIAARLCSLAEGDELCVSGEVHRSIRNQPGIAAMALGERELKNVPEPVAVYAVSGEAAPPRAVPATAAARGRRGASAVRWTVAGLAAIAIGVAGWLYGSAPDVAPVRSIAVLPLENLSGDPEQEYFADGMTDALIADLARVGSLRVTSRTSVMQYKHTTRSLREIAEELGVEALIEGSVIREGDRVRITAQLIDARSDHHLWAEHYDRDLRGVLALQSEIASAVARQVQARVAPQVEERLSSRPPVIPAAHEEYLKGRYFAEKHNPAAALRSRKHFESAMSIDPEYPLGYAGLADTLSCSPLHTWVVPGEDLEKVPMAVMDLAYELATRATELDPSLPEVQTALGLVYLFRDWDWEEAERRIEHAIEINPSLEFAHRSHAIVLAYTGRHDEAVRAIDRSRELDPLSAMTASLAARVYAWSGDTETAIALWRETTELDASNPLGRQGLGVAMCGSGRFEEGVAVLEEARVVSEDDPLVIGDLGHCYALAGDPERARALLRELEGRSTDDWVSPVSLARIHVGLGDRQAALDELERAYELRAYRILELGIDTRWDPVRSAPRFQDLTRRVGLTES
jgi:TolB-like protein/class 3 adenylate cyclase/Flp pilus assembly protein TadD